MSTAWINDKKAFDSVPHSWMIKCMQVYKIHPQIVKLIEKAMELWNTTLILQHSEGNIEIPDIKTWHGIFQGDSLYPLLFCLALDPLSNFINEQGHRYNLICNRKTTKETRKATHLLYMDYLKLITRNYKKLADQLKLVKQYSEDIQMHFGLDKCAKMHICTRKNKKNRQHLNRSKYNNTGTRT